MDQVININSLPEDILVYMFRYLTHNELGHVSRVCRRWNELVKRPVLWKKVDVKFTWCFGSQSEIASLFTETLPSTVTHMKLDFVDISWMEKLNFEEFCSKLKDKCPLLHTLILRRALLCVSLSTVIDLSTEYLPNLKALILPLPLFHNDCRKREHGGFSKLEVLDVSDCLTFKRSDIYLFSKMPYLKKLNLSGTIVFDNWFSDEDSACFLRQLEFLDLGFTNVRSRTFHKLQSCAVNLIELHLCCTELKDEDFRFSKPVFPLLKSICLIECEYVTCESIVCLVQSCPSLQNVHINRGVAQSYSNHPFVALNRSKLGIVKASDGSCDHKIELFS